MSERDDLLEAASTAWRNNDPRTGAAMTHPAWADLDAEGRTAAHDLAAQARQLEAALDPDGLSTTARAVLARIQRAFR